MLELKNLWVLSKQSLQFIAEVVERKDASKKNAMSCDLLKAITLCLQSIVCRFVPAKVSHYSAFSVLVAVTLFSAVCFLS